MEIEKQMLGDNRDRGTQSGRRSLGMTSSPSTLSPYPSQIILVIALFLNRQTLYPNSFRQLRGRSKLLPESCFQLKII